MTRRGFALTWHTELVTGPAAEPVATSDIKVQVNLPTSDVDDDQWISDAIKAARVHVEQRTRRSLVNTSWKYVANDFPLDDQPLYLPFPPLQSITTVQYYNGSNNSTTLASSDYTVLKPYEGQGYLEPIPDKTWPTTYHRRDAVSITFVAGYGSTDNSSVPATYKHAIKLLVGHWYENREAVMSGIVPAEVPLAFDSLLREQHWGWYG